MACGLVGAKPLSKALLPYGQLDPKEHISVNFYSKGKSFHSWKYALNIVCEIAANVSRPQCYNE